ncbi:hypothetical protein BDP27DRAFT_1530086 [Rhodocollybia butyracea]|uniref:alpha-1,6-mannosyl-glycoprotein 6-beta-N-acetylglucosaminyltransferase n=1 Tax=Rhodocollybia butyracea TaxID=206335 RepID=A0A9P5PRR6_9AGAR|nr:hypothetical protein BDP27DRAFT_1530086 [Rhodocollybia butyracea]
MSAYLPLPSHADSDDAEKMSSRFLQSRGEIRRSWNSKLLIASFVVLASILLFTFDIIYINIPQNAITKAYSDSASSALESFISHLFPIGMPNRTDNWENENSKAMRNLMMCMQTDTCGENQTSIVLLSSMHFSNAIHGDVSGEDIWCAINSLAEMGYTAIFAPDNHELARAYRIYPDLVKIVIAEGEQTKKCFKDPTCIKTPTHPLGIPAWKMLSFHFWTGSSNPLGNKWTLSPENYGAMDPHGNSVENVYLGYSIERACLKTSFVPSEERPKQVYVLAKYAEFFGGNNYAYPNQTFVPPADEPSLDDLKIVAGVRYTADGSEVPKAIHDLGALNKEAFYEQLGKSRALIGIGRPVLSPSPYDAMCMGVPFINPIMGFDSNKPEDRTKWSTQHDGLKYQNPPYVYHVKKGDNEGFWQAVKEAVEHPIERYIFPEMTMDALKRRVAATVEKDWRSMGAEVLKEREKSGEGEVGHSLLFYPGMLTNSVQLFEM